MARPPTSPTPPGAQSTLQPRMLLVGVPVVTFLVLTLVDPAAMRAIVMATVGSPQALAIVAGVVALTIGWSAILRRVVGNAWVHAGLVLLPTAIIAAVYIAPYYAGDTVVDDAFPVALAVPNTAADVEASSQPSVLPATPAPTPSPTSTPPPTAAPAGDAPSAATSTASEPSAAPAPQVQAPPPGPIELGRGDFRGLDGHFARGQAAVFDLGDGTLLLRLEEVDLQQVPEPRLYLVPAVNATAPAAGSIDLGALKGNVGNQNYDTPAELDVGEGDWTVLVWCEVFASPVGAAPLGRPA